MKRMVDKSKDWGYYFNNYAQGSGKSMESCAHSR